MLWTSTQCQSLCVGRFVGEGSKTRDWRTLMRSEPELCHSDDEPEEEEDTFTVRELRACEVSPTADSVERRRLVCAVFPRYS